MKYNPDVFRMYDIRGVFGRDLTNENVEALGKAIGTLFHEHKIEKCLVGRDNRKSGPTVSRSLIKGLCSTGIHVVNAGLIVTPMMYFSWFDLDLDAGIMITASHNPPQFNGFKIALHKQCIYGEKYQEIEKIAEAGKFMTGKGREEKYDIWPNYATKIKADIKLKRKLKLVLDCGNGTTGPYAPPLFKMLGCKVYGLYTESDGAFPNHPPYPQKIEHYGKLIKTIKKENADLGLAFDGDGDRVGVYDENGQFIENDRLAMLFTRNICPRFPGRKVVMNTSTSLAVLDDIKEHGGRPMLWKTGYPLITSKMKKVKAIFGAEISGHFFFSDRYYGYDDAIYAGARVAELASSSKGSFSGMFTDMPRYFETPEFRVPAPEKPDFNKFIIIDAIKREIKKEFPDAEVLDFDGVRFTINEGWGLIRASNTESLITGRAEAKTESDLKKLKNLIRSKLAKYKVKLNWRNPIA